MARGARAGRRGSAPTDATVLITGETGTGKELVARALHAASPRRDRPSSPSTARPSPRPSSTASSSATSGAPSPAPTGRGQGVFEAAHRGTLFLDEAGEMSLALQAKLLRVLVDGEVVRVGSTTPRSVDVRILVATHRDLERAGARRARSARTSTTAWRWCRSTCRRCGSAPEDMPRARPSTSSPVATELKVPPRRLSPEALAKLTALPASGQRPRAAQPDRAGHDPGARRDDRASADLPDLGRRPAAARRWIRRPPGGEPARRDLDLRGAARSRSSGGWWSGPGRGRRRAGGGGAAAGHLAQRPVLQARAALAVEHPVLTTAFESSNAAARRRSKI